MRPRSNKSTRKDRLPIGALLLLSFLLAAGCAAQKPAYLPALEKTGELYLYLQPLPQEAHRLTFTITDIAAIREDNTRVPLLLSPFPLEYRTLAGTQKRLAAVKLTPGLYRGLAVTVDGAAIQGEKGEAALLVPPEPITIEQQFKIDRKKTLALFLSLGSEKIIRNGYRFTPTFILRPPERHLSNLMGFVTNSLANVVIVFDKHTMNIVDVVATGSAPQGITLDRNRGLLYVATAGEDAVDMIDVATGESTGRIKLRFNDEPVDLALADEGRILVTANFGSNTASIIDADSRFETNRIRLDVEPTWVATEPADRKAYFFHPLTGTISVVNTANDAAVNRTLEEGAYEGEVSPEGTELYVISPRSPNLLVVDPASLAVRQRIFIGGGAVSLRVDTQTGLVYVGKNSGEIVVVDPASLMFIDNFAVGSPAAYLTIDNEENSLFVALPEKRRVLKIDLISKKVTGSIEVEEGSHAIAVMGER